MAEPLTIDKLHKNWFRIIDDNYKPTTCVEIEDLKSALELIKEDIGKASEGISLSEKYQLLRVWYIVKKAFPAIYDNKGEEK